MKTVINFPPMQGAFRLNFTAKAERVANPPLMAGRVCSY